MRDKIFKEIDKEREYQDNKWGDEFDSKNTLNDWVTYINIYLSNAAKWEFLKRSSANSFLKLLLLGLLLWKFLIVMMGLPLDIMMKKRIKKK